jgi:hypothetical protein
MKKSIYLLYFIPLFTLSGCFVADNFFIEEPPLPEKSLQTKTEEAVQKTINLALEDELYTPYGFSTIKIIKPIEIVRLDSLEKLKKSTPEDTALNSKIKTLEKEIAAHNLERRIKIDHFFTLQSDTLNLTILENQYLLNDTISVIDTKPKIILDVPLTYQEILNYYFNEYTIFISSSYTDSRRLSREFYAYFKKEIDRLSTIQEKSALLKNTLNLCLIVKKNGEFNQADALKLIFEDYIISERQDISSFSPIFYSDLYETLNKEDSTTTGYYFFHTFSGEYNGVIDTTEVMIRFNPYYQLVDITPLEKPIDNYLNSSQ